MPRVSVIIPTYNRAKYLPEALASVLKQTYRDYEIIVVDDGSTDNTAEIARQFPPEVRYFRQDNQGVSAARNFGIGQAKGEYIAFLDSDDLFLENALEKNVSFLDLHPEAGFCYGQIYKMDENGRQMRSKKLRGAKNTCVRDGNEQIVRILFRGDIAVNAVMVRRRCLDEAGLFNVNLSVGEDIDTWLRLAAKNKVGYLAEPLGKVRIHPENITTRGKFEELERSQTAFVERALTYVESDPAYGRLRRKVYFGLYCYLSEEATHKGHKSTGLRYGLKAIGACPELVFREDGISFLVTVASAFLPVWFRKLGKRMLTVSNNP